MHTKNQTDVFSRCPWISEEDRSLIVDRMSEGIEPIILKYLPFVGDYFKELVSQGKILPIDHPEYRRFICTLARLSEDDLETFQDPNKEMIWLIEEHLRIVRTEFSDDELVEMKANALELNQSFSEALAKMQRDIDLRGY